MPRQIDRRRCERRAGGREASTHQGARVELLPTTAAWPSQRTPSQHRGIIALTRERRWLTDWQGLVSLNRTLLNTLTCTTGQLERRNVTREDNGKRCTCSSLGATPAHSQTLRTSSHADGKRSSLIALDYRKWSAYKRRTQHWWSLITELIKSPVQILGDQWRICRSRWILSTFSQNVYSEKYNKYHFCTKRKIHNSITMTFQNRKNMER